jgi:hypothetical protein
MFYVLGRMGWNLKVKRGQWGVEYGRHPHRLIYQRLAGAGGLPSLARPIRVPPPQVRVAQTKTGTGERGARPSAQPDPRPSSSAPLPRPFIPQIHIGVPSHPPFRLRPSFDLLDETPLSLLE